MKEDGGRNWGKAVILSTNLTRILVSDFDVFSLVVAFAASHSRCRVFMSHCRNAWISSLYQHKTFIKHFFFQALYALRLPFLAFMSFTMIVDYCITCIHIMPRILLRSSESCSVYQTSDVIHLTLPSPF